VSATPECSSYRFPLFLAVVLIAAGSLPYAYGYWHAQPSERFVGFVGRAVPANNEYLMFAKQAQQGLWLFENRLTPEPLPRAYFGPEWWLFGRVARWTGLPLIGVFHLHRALAAVLVVFSCAYLISLCLQTGFQRRLALALIVFGSGFGWIPWLGSKLYEHLMPLAGPLFGANLPASLNLPPVLSRDIDGVMISNYLVNMPHFMLAGAFIVLTYAFLLAAERDGVQRRGYFILSGLCAMIHLLIRPYAFPEICLVYALFFAFMSYRDGRLSWGRFFNYAMMAVWLVPALAYYLILAHTNALGISGWERKSGYFFEYILWYGLPFVLLALYFQGLGYHRRMTQPQLLMTLWFCVAFFLAQLYPYFKAGEEAALFPFVVVPAVLAVDVPLRRLHRWVMQGRLWTRFGARRMSPQTFKYAAATTLVVFCSFSSLVCYGRMFTRLDSNHYSYYVSDDLYEAFMWLDAKSQPGEVVLTGLETCPFIPRYAQNKVFTGQDMLTSNFSEKNRLLWRFLGTRGDDQFKRELVKQFNIRYVLMGPREKMPDGIVPSDYAWLQPVFSRKTVTLYKAAL